MLDLLLLLAACTCGPQQETVTPEPPSEIPEREPFPLTDSTIPGFPDLRTSTSQLLQLDRMDAEISLPDVKLPPKLAEISDEWTLEAEELPNPRGVARKLMVLRAPLPFPVSGEGQTFAPEGMSVKIGDQIIPFSRTSAPVAARSTWRVNGRFLILTHPDLPAPGTLKVIYPGVREALVSHDPKQMKIAAGRGDARTERAPRPEEFVRRSLTIGGVTRRGLSLVAPTVMKWSVQLPTGRATFEGWLALERPPLNQPKSDGAAITLSVVAGGKEEVVDRQEIVDPAGGFRPWKVDLSAWAGQTVDLRISTETLQTAVFDWVFLGSPNVWGPPATDARRVVVVALDTTRPDKFSFYGYERPTTPEIDAWAKTGISFDKTWSTAPRTRPSFRSSTTGRLPLEAVKAPNISEVFEENGFLTAGIVANVHLQPRFDFDKGFDSWWFDGKANAEQQVDRTLAWLGEHQDVDSYTFVHFMDPHAAYDPPPAYREKWLRDPDPGLPQKVRREDVFAMARAGTLDDRRKAGIEDLHDAELAYLSHELGRLFDAIDKMPGRTLVVLHSDHGEEFWEHGGYEHNHSLYDELVRTVFIMRPRGGIPEGKRIDAPVTLMDLGPTLYDLFGFTKAPKYDGRSLVALAAGSAAKEDWSERPLPIGYLQYSHERWGVTWNGHKYLLHTGTGREELYDLAADPAEQKDLSGERDLTEYRKKLSEAHGGLQVGPGWRMRLSLEPSGKPLKVTLPKKPLSADVLDPESIVEHRANVEWGEPPRPKTMVGTVDQVSSDGLSFRFLPGPVPEGIVYVLFDEPVDPHTIKLSLGGKDLELTELKRGYGWKEGEHQVVVEPGIVVVPPETEAQRLGIVSDNNTEELCRLGYLEGEMCAGVLPEGGNDEARLDPEHAEEEEGAPDM